MSEYIPNWGDIRVQNRAKKAIKAITRYLHTEDHQHEFDRRWLNVNLGRTTDNLGRYLRRHLLKCKSHYYSKTLGIAKTYQLRSEGINKILNYLNMPPMKQFMRRNIIEQYAVEFQTGEFNYNEISDRFYHPLQNIKKDERYELFSEVGYQYQYDIQCCAPTLIYQAALKCGMKSQQVIERFLQDRTKFRDHLSATYNIEPKTIKTILTAIFTGAQLGVSTRSRLYQLVGNWSKMKALSTDSDIIQLKKEISRCWVWIRKFNTLKCNGTDKSKFYRQEEKMVMSSVRSYARLTNTREFSIHDGWITSSPMDLIQLTRYIQVNTGYNVIIDSEIPAGDHVESITSSKDEQVSPSVIRGQATHSENSLVLASPIEYNTMNNKSISGCCNVAIHMCTRSPTMPIDEQHNERIINDNKRRSTVLDRTLRQDIQNDSLGYDETTYTQQGHRDTHRKTIRKVFDEMVSKSEVREENSIQYN